MDLRHGAYSTGQGELPLGINTTRFIDTFLGLQHYHFMTPPTVTEPPQTKLSDVKTYPSCYGDFTLLYPPGQRCLPMNFGHLFKAKSELAEILNQISLTLLNNQGISPEQTFDRVHGTSVKLETWYKSLPTCLSPLEIVLPAQIKLQYFHILFNRTLQCCRANSLVAYYSTTSSSTFTNSCPPRLRF